MEQVPFWLVLIGMSVIALMQHGWFRIFENYRKVLEIQSERISILSKKIDLAVAIREKSEPTC